MKKSVLLLVVFFAGLSIGAQDISGKWNGMLDAQGTHLRIVFNITKTVDGYSATMDSPDQGAFGIPVTSTKYDHAVLILEISNARIKYEGRLDEEGDFIGAFNQGGQSFSLRLTTKEMVEEKAVRPQEPAKPYPYYTEEVKFENTTDKVTLAGTLSMPEKEGDFPAVVLITGSGPQNRDEALFGHKPFLVLADFLTKNGIAVLRFDDRGTGESTGEFNSATTFDFARDTESAIAFLQQRKEINKDKIGLIGHSEGGIIAPIIASENKGIDFIVLMAAPALRGDKLLLLQKYTMETQLGISPFVVENNQQIFTAAYEIILDESIENEMMADTLSKYFTSRYGIALPEEQKVALVAQLSSSWMVDYIRIDPVVYLKKTSCPILALNGSKDIQVPSKENLKVMESINGESDRAKVVTKAFEGLNHLFQACETGAVNEYGTIEQTISPIVLAEIISWINLQVK